MSSSHPHRSAPRPRAPRPAPPRTPRTADEAALRTLSYRRGHLTDAELDVFADLRGPLSTAEVEALKAVSTTLRRPYKRLRALDLIRYLGAPLTPGQAVRLPWFAGLTPDRPLPDTLLPPVALARHLFAAEHVPAFLFEPFADPYRYRPSVAWDLVRVFGMVANGRGLDGLRELDPSWLYVHPAVFEGFLATPPGVPVVQALALAFLRAWRGDPALVDDILGWEPLKNWRYGVPRLLRVAHSLCRDPVPPEGRDRAIRERLAALPMFFQGFGEAWPLDIPGDGFDGWRATECRTVEDFHAVSPWSSRPFAGAALGRSSLWVLRRGDAEVYVVVDVATGGVEPFAPPREPDPERSALLAGWARANGLS